MNRFIIAGNWKMNMPAEIYDFAALPKTPAEVEVLLCPPAPFLERVVALRHILGLPFVNVGAQDVSAADSGAFTGEVSGAMLGSLGVKYAIVGHSERRECHKETDEVVNKKAQAALRNAINPIICVGETLAERESGATVARLTEQVTRALDGLSDENIANIVVAYEPVWAIGTGVAASADDAQSGCKCIRGVVAAMYSAEIAAKLPILYGGSMNSKNASELLSCPDINGGLIGGAALDATAFCTIINAAVGIYETGGK